MAFVLWALRGAGAFLAAFMESKQHRQMTKNVPLSRFLASLRTSSPTSTTGSDPIELHRTLAGLAGEGIDHLAMEASSHGLDQFRLDGVRVPVATESTAKVKFAGTSRTGVYALRKQWSNEGSWVLFVTASQGPDDDVTAVVELNASGQVAAMAQVARDVAQRGFRRNAAGGMSD